MAKAPLGRLTGLIRSVFIPEILEELPEPPEAPGRTSLFRLVAGREALPEDTPVRADTFHFLSWLFRPEDLPRDAPVPSAGREPFLKTLLQRERLQEDPFPSPRAGRTPGARE